MKVILVQPYLAVYREELVEKLTENFDLEVWSDRSGSGSQALLQTPPKVTHKHCQILNLGTSLFFQSNAWRVPPGFTGKIVCFANPRFLSMWTLLLHAKWKGVKVLLHGQGLYSYRRIGLVRRLLYALLLGLSHRYLCYTELSRASLFGLTNRTDKLVVVENSLSVRKIILPTERCYTTRKVLFIGRLRSGCAIEILVQACILCREQGLDVKLEIIGTGSEEEMLRNTYRSLDWIYWHGEVLDHQEIANISQDCSVGCYPGDAGLSVLHMMALSLPPIVHGSISNHMGPEPSAVVDGVNGFVYSNRLCVQSLSEKLSYCMRLDRSTLAKIAGQAHATYLRLTNPSLGARFVTAISTA